MSYFSKMVKANLELIHSGAISERLWASLSLSFAFSPFAIVLDQINDWYFHNYSYIAFVFVAIIFDHALGTWVHGLIKRDFSIKKNIIGFFTKTVLVIIVGIIVEGMTEIMVHDNIIKDYFSLIARLMVFIYPAGSALMNCAVITNGKFPPIGFMERMKNFNKDLSINNFKEEKNEQNINHHED